MFSSPGYRNQCDLWRARRQIGESWLCKTPHVPRKLRISIRLQIDCCCSTDVNCSSTVATDRQTDSWISRIGNGSRRKIKSFACVDGDEHDGDHQRACLCECMFVFPTLSLFTLSHTFECLLLNTLRALHFVFDLLLSRTFQSLFVWLVIAYTHATNTKLPYYSRFHLATIRSVLAIFHCV